MIDKVQKIRKELERLKEETSIGLSEHENGVEQGRMEIINALSLFLDSLQEESKTDWLQELQERLDSLSKEDFKKVFDKYDVDFNEEPVSEDLEEAFDKYSEDVESNYSNDMFDRGDIMRACKFGAMRQKEQILKDSVLCGVDGWFINGKRNCRKNGRFHKYYVSTITHDKELPMKNGKDYRLAVIKDE